ncbi:MAG: hypothetical protein AB1918_00190 [Pseudomonadota bacterium]
MRILALAALAGLLAPAALAQEQPQQQAMTPGTQAGGPPVYEMVAADRETAWRINRVTGEVMICRIDTTGGLDSVRARCAPAALQAGGGGEQSMAPPVAGSAPR